MLYLQVPQGWNSTTVPFRTDVCIHQLFQQQAAAQPHAECLVFEGNAITYSQLDQKTNRLARYLRTLGTGRDIPVAVLMERSFDLIVAVMGKHLMNLSFCVLASPSFHIKSFTCLPLHYICLIMPSLIKSQRISSCTVVFLSLCHDHSLTVTLNQVITVWSSANRTTPVAMMNP